MNDLYIKEIRIRQLIFILFNLILYSVEIQFFEEK